MESRQRCSNSTNLSTMDYQESWKDAQLEVLKLRYEVSLLKFELRGTPSRSMPSREIWQEIMSKEEQIKQLKGI